MNEAAVLPLTLQAYLIRSFSSFLLSCLSCVIRIPLHFAESQGDRPLSGHLFPLDRNLSLRGTENDPPVGSVSNSATDTTQP